jgi:hypothetical protein
LVLVAPETFAKRPLEDVRFCHWNDAVPELVTDATTAKVAAPDEVVLSVLFVLRVMVFAASATSVSSVSSPASEALACTNAKHSAL